MVGFLVYGRNSECAQRDILHNLVFISFSVVWPAEIGVPRGGEPWALLEHKPPKKWQKPFWKLIVRLRLVCYAHFCYCPNNWSCETGSAWQFFQALEFTWSFVCLKARKCLPNWLQVTNTGVWQTIYLNSSATKRGKSIPLDIPGIAYSRIQLLNTYVEHIIAFQQ